MKHLHAYLLSHRGCSLPSAAQRHSLGVLALHALRRSHVYDFVGFSQYQPSSAYCCPNTGGRILYWLPRTQAGPARADGVGEEDFEEGPQRLPVLHDDLLLHPAAERLYTAKVRQQARENGELGTHLPREVGEQQPRMYGPYQKLNSKAEIQKDMTVVHTVEGPICLKLAFSLAPKTSTGDAMRLAFTCCSSLRWTCVSDHCLLPLRPLSIPPQCTNSAIWETPAGVTSTSPKTFKPGSIARPK